MFVGPISVLLYLVLIYVDRRRCHKTHLDNRSLSFLKMSPGAINYAQANYKIWPEGPLLYRVSVLLLRYSPAVGNADLWV